MTRRQDGGGEGEGGGYNVRTFGGLSVATQDGRWTCQDVAAQWRDHKTLGVPGVVQPLVRVSVGPTRALNTP